MYDWPTEIKPLCFNSLNTCRSGVGATNPSGSGLLLNTGLLFPKLDKRAVKMQ